MYFGHKVLIGIVTGTLLLTAVTTAATDKITHHFIDSEGNPVITNRPGECVETPNTSNQPVRLFERCNDIGDRDKDGIYDDDDVCPDNTPEEIVKGVYQGGPQKGCSLDSDSDGVPNYRDDCPQNTSLEISKGVDARGCPLDSDQDGVPDYKDLCPNTPFGVAVDENGCEIIEGSLELVLAGDVTFAYDKTVLTAQAQTTLDELVQRTPIYFVKIIEVVGHTDGVGSQEYNQTLSEERAQTVANYLIDKGVPHSKIHHWGEGKSKPIASNQTKVGRAQNRRVEIKIILYKKKN